jgi:uncharacterized membrane protein YqhA
MIEDKDKSSGEETWKDRIIITVGSIGNYLKSGSRIALIIIAILLFISAIVATVVGIIDLVGILKEVTTFSNNNNNNNNGIIHNLIILAEHFMIAITFFAICIALVHFSIPKPTKKELGELGEIKGLEKHIFSMVIATISVVFLSVVLTITNGDTNESLNTDSILKVGISIAAVVIALGAYIRLTKE